MTDTVNVPRDPTERMIKSAMAHMRVDALYTPKSIYRAMLAAAPKAEPAHDSDCALHNEPAYPNGPCDCTIKPVETLGEDDMKRARELRHDPDSEDNERFSSWFGDTLLDVHEAYVTLLAQPEAPKVEQEPNERGLIGAILDALWPLLGGNHTSAELWNDISNAVQEGILSNPAPSSDGIELRGYEYRSGRAEEHWKFSRDKPIDHFGILEIVPLYRLAQHKGPQS